MTRRRQYKLTITDESRLELIREMRFSRGGLIARAIVLPLGVLLVAFLIVAFTPLRKLTPGYEGNLGRDAALESALRLDSLQQAYHRERAFLDNFLTVINTDRVASDSAELAANPSPLTVDSLLGPSVAEMRFRSAVEGRERYNRNVLAPLAADGMMFTSVGEDYVVTEASRQNPKIEIVIAKGSPIYSVADGTVLDVHYDNSTRGYIVMLQHERGFVTRYSRLVSPMVEAGDHVDAGQVIALQEGAAGQNKSIIALEMWRNGDVVLPAQILF